MKELGLRTSEGKRWVLSRNVNVRNDGLTGGSELDELELKEMKRMI